MKKYWICNKCNEKFEEKDIAEIHYVSQVYYSGIDAEVICKRCKKQDVPKRRRI